MEAVARKANVLFVDDEPRVLTSMRALFRRDYNVHLANSGAEALALLERETMDVIVSDQRMPGMTGVDVLKACRQRAPSAMRILLTGYADKDAIAAAVTTPIAPPSAAAVARPAVAPAAGAAGTADGTAAEARPLARVVAFTGRHRAAQTAPVSSAGAAVDLLVLSEDSEFTRALEAALGMSHRLHAVRSVEHAVEVLDAHPVGVLITDTAINGDAVQRLTAELKHHVPELVTIVASDHSDAHRLIDLINTGQVFRFLLKPIKPAQTSIWIESAVGKHLELVRHPELVARHAVAPPSSSLLRLGDRLRTLASRFLRLRGAVEEPQQP
jgi:DNA-binding NtrC family response regulator